MTSRSADDFRQTATSELPKRDSGNATDYRQALTGAKKDLESRAEGLKDADACKVLLWFTDGALDVDEQTGVAANEICQPGGIADSVRHAGINVVALALFTPGARVTSTQRDQLRRLRKARGKTHRAAPFHSPLMTRWACISTPPIPPRCNSSSLEQAPWSPAEALEAR